ncbi:hypothetical protein PybrP1_008472 [[Pythium] brassicae (nom. inval.)]|nr:hypothetical protein PybrP1_008472 [[Pythium] brassicae (nom. inval.)]
MAATPRRYSLFQRGVRVVQTTWRRTDWWLMQRMPGIPNPPEMEEKLRQPTFVDLWEFTLLDHARNVRLAWRQYVASFDDPSDEEVERSKREVANAVRRLRGQVEDTAGQNLEFIGEQLEGTKVLANLRELRATGEQNLGYLKGELAHAKDAVDTDAVAASVRAAVEETRSKQGVAATLASNVHELADLVKSGRDAALRMEKRDVEAAQANAQSWFADKLLVGQSVLLAFIDGYKEGKQLELKREDALLLTLAKQAAEEQRGALQQQFDALVASQRDKQRREQEAADARAETTDSEATCAAAATPTATATAGDSAQKTHTSGTSRSETRVETQPSSKEPQSVSFSDDEDDSFQYTAVDDAALGIDDGGDDDDDDDDFEAVLRNLSKSAAVGGSASASSYDAYPGEKLSSPEKHEGGVGSLASSPSPSAASLPRVHTQVRPSVVDDFIRNFLLKVGMARTLDLFNHEWYDFIAKGKLKEDDVGVVPDIYLRNQALDDQVKELRTQLDETRKVTAAAKGTWDKFRHQRDVHKMHHQRVLQEKDALVAKIRKLEKHVASYEPLLQELKAKYENSMKEKMLMRLERDRQMVKAEALEAQLKALGSSHGGGVGGAGAGAAAPKAKGDLAGAAAQSSKASTLSTLSSSSSSGKKSKRSENETKIPTHDGANPFLEKRFEPANVERMELAKTCQGHGNSIAAIAFHPKNPIVATVSDDETWKLWSVPTCELIMSGEGHRSWLAGIAFHPKGTHVATSSGDNTVKIWDFVSASCSLTLSDHAHPVWESVFHHDGEFLVSASMDHTCKLWDLATGKCRKTLRGHVDSVNSVCFQPFTGNICTGSGDKTVSIWDMRSGLCVQTFYGHQNACNTVAFSLAGDVIASCDADGFVKVWDVRMVAERATLDGGQHSLNSVAFDRSGKVLASASDDGSVKVFSLKTNELATELKGHDGPVQSVKFEPSGRFLASSSSDCTFRLWST